MKLFLIRQTDDEYVDKIQRSIDRWDRWGIWLMLGYAAIIIAMIWWIVDMMQGLPGLIGQLNIPAQQGAQIGGAIGLGIGFSFSGVIGVFVMAGMGFRRERLLLKYYDASHVMPSDEKDSDVVDNDAKREW